MGCHRQICPVSVVEQRERGKISVGGSNACKGSENMTIVDAAFKVRSEMKSTKIYDRRTASGFWLREGPEA
jgi:hypothetical protein